MGEEKRIRKFLRETLKEIWPGNKQSRAGVLSNVEGEQSQPSGVGQGWGDMPEEERQRIGQELYAGVQKHKAEEEERKLNAIDAIKNKSWGASRNPGISRDPGTSGDRRSNS